MINLIDILGISYLMELFSGSNTSLEEPGQSVATDGLDIESKFYLKEHPIQKFNYRPENLEDYISQDNAKALIRLLLKEIIEIGKIRHIIISGTRGHGKTTLAKIISNQLGFEFNYFISNSFTMQHLKDFLIKNEQATIPQVLMLDEVHGLDPKIIEFFYPILEDMILPNSGAKLRPFILISATTEMDFLQKKYAPFIDRMVSIQLEPYKASDIEIILRKYNDQVYHKNISDEVFRTLSANGRYNPRTSILLFDLFIASGNVNEVLKCNRIIKNGLTSQDLLILEHLQLAGTKPVGCETLAIIGHTDSETYKTLLEPYLLQEGYLNKFPRGRAITEKGKQLLQEIK